MRTALRLSTALTLLSVLFALHPAVGRANCPPLGANQQCYDQPHVTDPTFNPAAYTFAAGSHVRIQADGCVQTGGSGDTWKRYVNPDPQYGGSASYHGRVGIYSSTGGATTLSNTRLLNLNQSTTYRVTTPSYLQVGFEDDGYPTRGDGYDDNGYDSHDDGNGQCTESFASGPVTGSVYGSWGYGGPAYILLTVTPNAAPDPTADQPDAYVAGTVSLSGSATDADADPLHYRFLVDGTDVSGSLNNASFNWNSTNVGDGLHTVALTASDPYTAKTSAGRTFRVDNTSPTVAITSGPSNQTFGPGSTQSWSFSASDSGSGVQAVQCRVDGAPVTCKTGTSHSVSNLPGGTHTFSVQATDKVGHVSSVDSRTFAIDATPPDTTVTAGPADGATTTDSTVTYAFASSEPGSTFQCRVYSDQPAPVKPAFTACSGGSADVISGLSPGAYVLEADATDAYGNADPTPVVRHFTIAAPATQGGTPTGGGGGTPTGGGGTPTGGGGTPAAPVVTAAPPAKRTMRVTLAYAYSSPTRLTKLTLRHVPRGATVRVTCRGKCPKALRKRYTKRHAKSSLSLARLVRHGLKPGVTLKIVVSKPGWKTVTKTVRIRRGKRPVVR